MFSQGSGSQSFCCAAKDILHFVDQIVIPGMILSAPSNSKALSWSLGSGVVLIPQKTENGGSICMLVRKVRYPALQLENIGCLVIAQ